MRGLAKKLYNQTFNRWTVIGGWKRKFSKSGRPRIVWWCECECGTKRWVASHMLISGGSKSCGCLTRDTMTKHGYFGKTEYNIWATMLSRCSNPNATGYDGYGGRGISVCERWGDFTNFLKDMGARPSPKHSLDRIDNNKGYSPDNCRWATQKQQHRNTRKNHFITHPKTGETFCIAEWEERLNINKGLICNRLQLGWPIIDIFETPPNHKRAMPKI